MCLDQQDTNFRRSEHLSVFRNPTIEVYSAIRFTSGAGAVKNEGTEIHHTFEIIFQAIHWTSGIRMGAHTGEGFSTPSTSQ